MAIGPEQRRLRLVRPVRAAEPLDRGVGLPPGFEQVVDPQPLVLRPEVGVVAPPCAARVGEDEDALLVVLEGGGLGEVGARGPPFDRKPVNAVVTALADDSARTSGHLGHDIGPEPLHDLVERALDGRQ